MRFAIPVCQIPYTRMMRSTLTNVAVNQESNSEVWNVDADEHVDYRRVRPRWDFAYFTVRIASPFSAYL